MKKYIFLFVLLICPLIFYFVLRSGKPLYHRLPFLGPHEVATSVVDGKEKTDTLFHSIPGFSLTNQYGQTITEANLDGKITVSGFFFASCPTICPMLNRNLSIIQEKFKTVKEFQIISHTVDPKHDSIPVLAAYSAKFNAIEGKWHFLTGPKEGIYRLAIKGYLVTASEDAISPGGFIHSEMLVLVDKERHIRGFYDGTKKEEVDKLAGDINFLFAEYGVKEAETKLPRRNNQQ